jgi:hypothetical protein
MLLGQATVFQACTALRLAAGGERVLASAGACDSVARSAAPCGDRRCRVVVMHDQRALAQSEADESISICFEALMAATATGLTQLQYTIRQSMQ